MKTTKLYSSLRKAALVATAGALLLSAACKKQSAAANPFPESQQVSGWAKAGETRTFSPDKLSDYIDGDAEKYIKAGVQNTSTADYKFQDKVEAAVDVYTMSNADGAKSILSAEPMLDAKALQLGDEGRAYSQSVLFRKGPHFVRIVAYQDGPEVQQALTALGQGVDQKLSK